MEEKINYLEIYQIQKNKLEDFLKELDKKEKLSKSLELQKKIATEQLKKVKVRIANYS